ncbi:MAG: hypothetical protein EXS18_04220 [Verrucomicrobiae bacterium]|nr:hypothetical protein [Verrucomicrobiae bacterium]
MKCQECQQQFEAVLGGKIESTARSTTETHLSECARCASAFAEARQLWALLGQAPSYQPSNGFADRVLGQLDEAPAHTAHGWMAWPSSLRWTAATAMLVVAIGVTSFTVHRHRQQARQLAQFEELFNLVQNVDPETVVNVAAFENGDAL